MAGLTEPQRAALTAVIDRAPDALLTKLAPVAAAMGGERAAQLSEMLVALRVERRRRARAFGPLLPMFRARADGVDALTFPPGGLSRVWAATAAREPGLAEMLDLDDPQAVQAGDHLCQTAAGLIRNNPSLASLDADARVAEDLAISLDLAPLVRRALPTLEAWVRRPDENQVAELRLLLRDCTGIHPDGARRALEILFAHLADAVLVLRILTWVSGEAARERFLAGTELASFVERITAAIGARSVRVLSFQPRRDADGVDAVIADLSWCAVALAELDLTLELDPGGPWGASVRGARQGLSRHISDLLAAADKAAAKAFPSERVRVAGQMTRRAPKLTSSRDGEDMVSALNLLRLVGSLRRPAAALGAEAARAALVETLTGRLSDWADEALNLVNHDEAEDEVHALRLVEQAAVCLDALGADQAARTVRRRVAAAGAPKTATRPSSRVA